MTNPTGKGGFQRGQSGNPGGRPKLPAEMREMFQAKAPEAFEVLTRCLQSDDDRVAMMAAASHSRPRLWKAGAIDRCQYQ